MRVGGGEKKERGKSGGEEDEILTETESEFLKNGIE